MSLVKPIKRLRFPRDPVCRVQIYSTDDPPTFVTLYLQSFHSTYPRSCMKKNSSSSESNKVYKEFSNDASMQKLGAGARVAVGREFTCVRFDSKDFHLFCTSALN